jgi:hypothetical protein
MTTTIEVLHDAPIIVVSLEPGGSVLQDISDHLTEIIEMVAAQPEPVFLALDLSGVMLRLDQVSLMMARMARGPGSLLHHPRLRETAVVTASRVVTTALRIVEGGLFDGVQLTTWETREAALAYLRAKK